MVDSTPEPTTPSTPVLSSSTLGDWVVLIAGGVCGAILLYMAVTTGLDMIKGR